jgi:two-component system nitrate/nitrite response regulator NarP
VHDSGTALIEALRAKPVEIAIVGWTLPDMTGGAVLARVKQEKWQTRIVIYTGERSNDVLKSSVKGGAWGFVSKTEDPQVLLEAVVSVARGRLSLPYVDIDLLNHDPLEGLTARERELLAALANGWTNLQIAARTGISRNTVKYHLKNLYDKLGVSNRAMAVALHVSVNRNDD